MKNTAYVELSDLLLHLGVCCIKQGNAQVASANAQVPSTEGILSTVTPAVAASRSDKIILALHTPQVH